MKMYLISDNVDTYTGMRLAGVDGVVVHEREELRQALEDVLSDKNVGIVLLTEKFGREFPISLIHSVWSGSFRSLWKYLTGTEPAVRKTLSHPTLPRQSD